MDMLKPYMHYVATLYFFRFGFLSYVVTVVWLVLDTQKKTLA